MLYFLAWGGLVALVSPTLDEDALRPLTMVVLLAVLCVVALSSTLPLVTKIFLPAALMPLAIAWILNGTDEAPGYLASIGLVWLFAATISAQRYLLSRQLKNTVAECRALTEQFFASREQLSQAHRSQTRILTTASHDLRQPVHALGLLVERLRMDVEAVAVRDQIETIGAVSQSLAYSLGLLLDISRLETGTVTATLVPISLLEIFEQLEAQHSASARAKSIRLHFEHSRVWVESDPVLLQSILGNLLSNAIRYTDAGSVSVVVRRAEASVWIDVVDTGVGVPTERQNEIFGEYVRLADHRPSPEGFGLGLAIVRRTADLLGHRLELDSHVGHGSRFSIQLPLSADRQEQKRDLDVQINKSLSGKRGLLIDNDPIVLKGMESMLQAWGCSVVSAESFEELKFKLEFLNLDIDFVIADYHLNSGGQNGIDAIREIRARSSKYIPATLLTGDIGMRSASEHSESYIRVMHKPVQPSRLRLVIDAMIEETPKTPKDERSA